MREAISVAKATIKATRNTAIIGLNRSGLRAFNRIKEHLSEREKLLGIIDVHDRKMPNSINWKGIKYLGRLKDFSKIVAIHNINNIVIAIDPDDIAQVHEIVSLCKIGKIEYEFASEVHDIVYGHAVHQIFKDLQRPWEFSPRQIIDSLLAALILLFFFPMFMISSILIKLNSAGPVLYSQERIGKKGRIFRMFKFRSMFIDAEKFCGPVLAKKNDPRITGVGRLLRRTRIDEIPQLINVLIGDMGFIGPRPERPYFVEKYSHEIPLYKTRLKLKPGITGLAQVNAGYDESLEDVKLKLSYDLQYVKNYRSPLLNLFIILKTIRIVLTGQGQ